MSDHQELEVPDPYGGPLTTSAATIWRRAKVVQYAGTSYRLLLAVYTGPFPSAAPHAQVDRVLAWVVMAQHVPFVFHGSIPSFSSDGTTVPRPICQFVDTVTVFDARTGRRLASSLL